MLRLVHAIRNVSSDRKKSSIEDILTCLANSTFAVLCIRVRRSIGRISLGLTELVSSLRYFLFTLLLCCVVCSIHCIHLKARLLTSQLAFDIFYIDTFFLSSFDLSSHFFGIFETLLKLIFAVDS